jgi:hypothetical protein
MAATTAGDGSFDGTDAGVMVMELSGGEITALRSVANPGKLRFAARQAARLSRQEPLSGLHW